MKKIITILFILFPLFVKAEEMNLSAQSSILIEASTGKIIYKNRENDKLSPASMTKMMSMLLIIEKLESGEIKEDDKVLISSNAASMGGSQVYLQANSQLKVSELMKAIAIASANDAVVALAEYTYGTEENFVTMMNDRCKDLGCKNTNFKNPHGLDEEEHYSSAYDMSLIAKELVKHKKILELSSTYEDYLNKPDGSRSWLVNTNKLVKYYQGLDGLKTGYTENAGYCLTATAKRNNMRLISVVMHEPDSKIRNNDTINLLNYGFANYKVQTILEKNKELEKIYVYNSKKQYYQIGLKEDVNIIENIIEKKSYNYNIILDEIKAPVKQNKKVGYLEVLSDGIIVKTIDIITKEQIKKANIFDYYIRNLKIIINGIIKEI